MMLPNELIWVMEKLGFDWPDIDEDELRRGGQIVGNFKNELEEKIQAIDRKVNGDLVHAIEGQAGPAYVAAWNSNRSQNLDKLLGLLTPVPVGVEVMAAAVLALKIKVIVDLTTTMIALVAMLTNPVTALGAGPMVIIKKKLLNAAVDIAVEQMLEQVLPLIIEPMAEQLPAVVMAILDAPAVEAVAGEPDKFYADLQALEQIEGELEQHGDDIDSLTSRLFADLSTLNIGGD